MAFASALDGAIARASNPEFVGRVHFARYLVAAGVVPDVKAAFRRFLAEGKPAYVRHGWTDLAQAVHWIGQAGGVAVLAHPLRYGLRVARLRALLESFRALGGCAMEVVTASCNDEQARLLANLGRETGLVASAGSDFHSPEESWLDIGEVPALPPGCDAVWARWPMQDAIAAA
ncbi:MAG TPA: hypothetical protein VHH12_05065 [Mycobacterium sp.]|nr:hypothetical protein [Mycobacterium sp.]